jgi:hypothetical protein
VYRRLDLAASAAAKWYSFKTTRDGLLSLQAAVITSGTVEIELYGKGLDTPLAVSTSIDGRQRIDREVQAGQQYYVKLTGNSTLVDLRLSNQVLHSGTDVFVFGSAGDDEFRFEIAQTRLVTVNGIAYSFASAAASAFYFQGAAGHDSAMVIGGAGPEATELWPRFSSLVGPGYTVVVTRVEEVAIDCGSGDSIARMYGSSGDDTLTADAVQATLSGNGFSNTVHAGTIRAFGGRGNDSARLDDSIGDELFEATPNWAQMTGEGFSRRVAGFEAARAFASSGSDRAVFWDSKGDDAFLGRPDWSRMTGDGYLRRAAGFDVVRANAHAGGNDQARLEDSAGDEVFTANPRQAGMVGDTFAVHVSRFPSVVAVAQAGGTDVARLYGSAGADAYTGTSTFGEFAGTGFRNRGAYFDVVHAFGSGGDQASLSDSAGDDLFRLTPGLAVLSGEGFRHRLVSFSRVEANATQGGNDEASFSASPGDDLLEAQDNWARLSSVALDYLYEAIAFDLVRATAASATNHKHAVEPLTYMHEWIGPWTDI